jgi:hypothetical protein
MHIPTRNAPAVPPAAHAGWQRLHRTRAMHGALLSGLLALSGCTTVGVHTAARESVDYGPPATVRVCLLQAADIPPERAEALKRTVREEFAQYGLNIEVPWVREWTRPGFQVGSIMRDLLERPLEPPCDRLFGLVDRHAGDFAWGLVLPEILGAVDEVTATRGYAVATFGSLNQLVSTPEQTIVHEFYHLFGCPHGVTLSDCYPKIAALKAAAQPEADFFPGVSRWRPAAEREAAGKAQGDTAAAAPETFLTTRAQADAAIAAYLAEEAASRSAASSSGQAGAGSR